MLSQSDNAIKVFEYPEMIHAKLLFVDDEKSFFGSANFNKQAAEKLWELNYYDPIANSPLNKKLKRQLEADIRKSKQVFIESLPYNKVKAILESAV